MIFLFLVLSLQVPDLKDFPVSDLPYLLTPCKLFLIFYDDHSEIISVFYATFSAACFLFAGFPAFLLSYAANNPARSVPEIECHVQDTAQIIADSGATANCAVVVARLVASPAFCIPTSMEIVLFFAVFIPVSLPAPYPSRYPSPL